MVRPGVLGSMITSASGGLLVPSMLSARVFAIRAVIASRLGMFLYPRGTLVVTAGFSKVLCFSRVSLVRASPLGISPASLVVEGAPPSVEKEDGDALLVEPALTATESAVLAREVVDPPARRANAARRGRLAELGEVLEGTFTLIRAASWLRDGGRFDTEGRSLVLVIVVVEAQPANAVSIRHT